MTAARQPNYSVKAELTRDMLDVINAYFERNIPDDGVASIELRDNVLWLCGPDGERAELIGMAELPPFLRLLQD